MVYKKYKSARFDWVEKITQYVRISAWIKSFLVTLFPPGCKP